MKTEGELAPSVALRLTGDALDGGSWALWLDELADSSVGALALVGDITCRADVVTRCDDVGVMAASSVADISPQGNLVVVIADLRDRPGRSVVRRLVRAATADSTSMHTARLLPLDPDPGRSELACIAMTTEWTKLWRLDPLTASADRVREDLRRAAAHSRTAVVVCPAATVVRDLTLTRVDSESRRVLAARRDGAPPSVRRTAPAPTGHPASLPGTSVGVMLADLGLALPSPQTDDRPFLSIITRTQGLRIQCLAESLDCLAAQSLRDFELILTCHRIHTDDLARVRSLVDAQPEWLRAAIRLIEVSRPGRSAPINDALGVAAGRYAAVLDDDDTVLSDWVATFAELEQQCVGAVLRAGAVRQDVAAERPGQSQAAGPCPEPVAEPTADWPADFSLIDHLHGNYSPCMTVAFPRGFFADLGQRFDETLDTTEDWHYLVRAAALLGVANSPRLTSVYRWWIGGGSSREAHDENEWARGREYVMDFLDQRLSLLPPGSARHLEDVRKRSDQMAHEIGLAAQAGFALNDRYVSALRSNSELNDRLVKTLASHQTQAERIRHLQTQLAKRTDTVARLRKQVAVSKEKHRRFRAAVARIYGATPPPGIANLEVASIFDLGVPRLESIAAAVETTRDARRRGFKARVAKGLHLRHR